MVIGNGMLAKAFDSYRNQDAFLIFASGVSNSSTAAPAAFEREKQLLIETSRHHTDKTLVYLSTCSIYDESMLSSNYVQHKLKMEELVKDKHPHFIIFRLTNPVGNSSNPHTVINYFINKIIAQQPFAAWKHASRNIIDIDHMYLLCNDILQQKKQQNAIVNIANPHNYTVPFIISTIEKHFNTKANYTLLDKGDEPLIDISATAALFTKFNINFDEHYLSNLLKKYFPRQ